MARKARKPILFRAALKTSIVCWRIVGAYFLFFFIPFELMSPRAAAVLSLSVGFGFLASLGFYIYRLKNKEGFEFGWFLAQKHGSWLLLPGAVALALVLIGGGWLIAPQLVEPHLKEGAMPLAALLVVLFWCSLIFTFLAWALVCYAESVGYLRIRDFKWAAGGFALASFWLALATLFCSLFLDVINDNFLTISGGTRNVMLGVFALAVTVTGLCSGGYVALERVVPGEDIDEYAQKRAVDVSLVK